MPPGSEPQGGVDVSAKLKLHELTGSPNTIKDRSALGTTGLENEREPH